MEPAVQGALVGGGFGLLTALAATAISLLGGHRFNAGRETKARLRLEAADFVSGCEQLFDAEVRQQRGVFHHARAKEASRTELIDACQRIMNAADDERAAANAKSRGSRFGLQLLEPGLNSASDELYEAATFGSAGMRQDGASVEQATRFDRARDEFLRQVRVYLN